MTKKNDNLKQWNIHIYNNASVNVLHLHLYITSYMLNTISKQTLYIYKMCTKYCQIDLHLHAQHWSIPDEAGFQGNLKWHNQQPP